MAYTHTFEIKVNGNEVEGEIDFSDIKNPIIKFTDREQEILATKYREINDIIQDMINCKIRFPEVKKVALNKK